MNANYAGLIDEFRRLEVLVIGLLVFACVPPCFVLGVLRPTIIDVRGLIVEATAALAILLYLAWLRFGGTWNQTSTLPGVLWSVVTPRSIKSQDLDCSRRFIPEDLVLDLHRLKAPFASRSIRRSRLSSCL